ncbi:MAG: hypothetical protein ABIR08_05845 [Sphingomonas sp.]
MSRAFAPYEKLNVLCLKAFGDFTIAAASIEKIDPTERHRVRLVAGSHLAPLAAAVAPDVEIAYVDVGAHGVPPLFDIRKHGVRKAIRSGIGLRRAMRAMGPTIGRSILVDRADHRAHFLFDRYDISELPPGSRNIYDAYQVAFSSFGLASVQSVQALATPASDLIGILPGSRIAAKNLPPALVAQSLDTCRRSGKMGRLILVHGERPDLEAAFSDAIVIVHDFGQLAAALRGVGQIISADSLPAHLAERSAIPVFVLSPVDNSYWLPKSSFDRSYWCLFKNDDAGWDRLEKFVAR